MTDWSSPTGAGTSESCLAILIWVGIVKTAANFGVSGMKPTTQMLEHLGLCASTQIKTVVETYHDKSGVHASLNRRRKLKKPKTLIQITGCCGDRICGVWKQNHSYSVLFASGTLNPRWVFDNIVNL